MNDVMILIRSASLLQQLQADSYQDNLEPRSDWVNCNQIQTMTVAALCPRFSASAFRHPPRVMTRLLPEKKAATDHHQPVRNRSQMHLQRYFA